MYAYAGTGDVREYLPSLNCAEKTLRQLSRADQQDMFGSRDDSLGDAKQLRVCYSLRSPSCSDQGRCCKPALASAIYISAGDQAMFTLSHVMRFRFDPKCRRPRPRAWSCQPVNVDCHRSIASTANYLILHIIETNSTERPARVIASSIYGCPICPGQRDAPLDHRYHNTQICSQSSYQRCQPAQTTQSNRFRAHSSRPTQKHVVYCCYRLCRSQDARARSSLARCDRDQVSEPLG